MITFTKSRSLCMTSFRASLTYLRPSYLSHMTEAADQYWHTAQLWLQKPPDLPHTRIRPLSRIGTRTQARQR